MRIRQSRESPFTDVNHLLAIRCMSEMAFVLVLAQTGAEPDEQRMDDLCDKVACVAEELYLSPEDVQRVLEMHEPSLALGGYEQ